MKGCRGRKGGEGLEGGRGGGLKGEGRGGGDFERKRGWAREREWWVSQKRKMV